MCIAVSNADRVSPIIQQGQAQVDALIGGTPGRLTSAQAQQLLKDRPDVAAEFQRASAAADRNSPAFTQKGLDSAENYASYWYTQMGGNKQYTLPGTDTTTPEQQQADLITSLTNGVGTAMAEMQKQAQSQVDELKAMNTSLTATIGQQQAQFASSQAELMAQVQKTQAEQTTAMQKALADMIKARDGNAQPAKKPNYARAMARNRELNSQGLSSTMLTGPRGVTPGSMSLGLTSLLGA